jgi:hypothetical protein
MRLRSSRGPKPALALVGALATLGVGLGAWALVPSPFAAPQAHASPEAGERSSALETAARAPLAPLAPLAPSCASESALFAVDDVLSQPAHPCRAWVAAAAARSIALNGLVGEHAKFQGSGTLLRAPSGSEAVPFVSALHVVATDERPEGGRARATPPSSSERAELALRDGIGAHVTDARGGFDPLALAIVPLPVTLPLGAAFGLDWARCAADRWEALAPAHDFSLGLVWPERGGRWSSGALDTTDVSTASRPVAASFGAAVATAPLEASAPLDALVQPGELKPGSLVLAVGFPILDASGRPLPSARSLYGVVLRVADEAETRLAAHELSASTDGDAEPPYEGAAEVLLRSELGGLLPGMSGGGVFDAAGRLVGVAVRADEPAKGARRYARAVRLTHVASELRRAGEGLPAPLRREVAAWLPPEVAPAL